MFRATSEWDRRGLDDLQAFLTNFPKETELLIKKIVVPYISKQLAITVRKAAPPSPWSLDNPVPWTSERQHRKYWFSKGFGMGIPTKRTNQYINAWQVRGQYRHKPFRAEVVVRNVDKRKNYPPQFIAGPYQQRFHRITGWLPYEPTIGIIMDDAALIFGAELRRLWNSA